eukprot:CAMPEP_0202446590 /NCGR_PEP_ID=MMETSP1360-20130828/5115_1 /ASSEMBLY_ACC=CAM_ASM_000848 /TAXON_ID=515479 /ORGANISM="Licmophora paradoxa, Strain CCMP2313" /LENGTH=213 /DNA_ID=CAMNT_0049063161 /DNA_START=15 /DNA_END=652 /DNA_ORIENTATION=-
MVPSSSPSTPFPSTMPSASPTSAPTPTDGVCDDDNSITFFVADINKNQRCVWLAARPQYQTTMCVPGNIVFDICEETCGKCHDLCYDTNESFVVDGVERDCAWLSLRFAVQDRICIPSHGAYSKCPETCNSCPQERISAPTDRPSILLGIAPVETESTSPTSPTGRPSILLGIAPAGSYFAPNETPTGETPAAPTYRPSILLGIAPAGSYFAP